MAIQAKTIALHEVLAVEKTVKAKAHKVSGDVYQRLQKAELINGLTRTYAPEADGGETFPDESKKVQLIVAEELAKVAIADTDYLDVIATKDVANTKAKADVVVDDVTILNDVPVTTLLTLEKHLVDLHTQVMKLPVLSLEEDWTYDSNKGYYKARPTTSRREEKVTEPLQLSPATDKHPAQVQLITKQVLTGHWTTTKLSGALPADKKAAILRRVEDLQKAVKTARERANSETTTKVEIGEKIFDYILK